MQTTSITLIVGGFIFFGETATCYYILRDRSPLLTSIDLLLVGRLMGHRLKQWGADLPPHSTQSEKPYELIVRHYIITPVARKSDSFWARKGYCPIRYVIKCVLETPFLLTNRLAFWHNFRITGSTAGNNTAQNSHIDFDK